MIVLAIDPGVRAIGYALAVDGGVLTRAGVSKAPRRMALGECAVHHAKQIPSAGIVYLESMGLRPTDGLARCKDLLNVQSVGCLVAGMLGVPVLVPVHEWKSNLSKMIMHPRTLAALSPSEREIVDQACEKAGKTHAKEVLDAVGILMYRLGRTTKGGSRV